MPVGPGRSSGEHTPRRVIDSSDIAETGERVGTEKQFGGEIAAGEKIGADSGDRDAEGEFGEVRVFHNLLLVTRDSIAVRMPSLLEDHKAHIINKK